MVSRAPLQLSTCLVLDWIHPWIGLNGSDDRYLGLQNFKFFSTFSIFSLREDVAYFTLLFFLFSVLTNTHYLHCCGFISTQH